MSVVLYYRAPFSLPLGYGKVVGLGCTAERPGEVAVSRHSTAAPVSVRICWQFQNFRGAS